MGKKRKDTPENVTSMLVVATGAAKYFDTEPQPLRVKFASKSKASVFLRCKESKPDLLKEDLKEKIKVEAEAAINAFVGPTFAVGRGPGGEGKAIQGLMGSKGSTSSASVGNLTFTIDDSETCPSTDKVTGIRILKFNYAEKKKMLEIFYECGVEYVAPKKEESQVQRRKVSTKTRSPNVVSTELAAKVMKVISENAGASAEDLQKLVADAMVPGLNRYRTEIYANAFTNFRVSENLPKLVGNQYWPYPPKTGSS